MRIGSQGYQWIAYYNRFGLQINWKLVCYEAAQAGYAGVELTGYLFDQLPGPDEVAEYCQSVGVRVVAVSGGLKSEDDLEALERRLKFLKAIGASALVVGVPASRGLDEEGRAKRLGEFIELTKRLADLCSQYEIPAGVHNHLWTVVETEEELRRFLDAQTVDWCPDFGHAAAAACDVMGLLREYGDRIVHGHLKDAMVDETGQFVRFCELGRGNVGLDFPLILHVLEQQGYERWLVVEQDHTTVTPMYDQAVNRDYLASIGYEWALRA